MLWVIKFRCLPIKLVGKVIMSDGLKFKTLQEGAATHVVAAFDPTLKGEQLVLSSEED